MGQHARRDVRCACRAQRDRAMGRAPGDRSAGGQDVARRLPPHDWLAADTRSAAAGTTLGQRRCDRGPPAPASDNQPGTPPSDQNPDERQSPEEGAGKLPYESAPLAQWRDKLDVPVGWFSVGHKCDVPKEACFVGHYCDNYVWVMPEHFSDMSHFTLIVLGITKHGVASNQPTRGLDYVRR